MATSSRIKRDAGHGERATQDEMEFLSVGLNKQPQFRSHDGNQPRKTTRRDSTRRAFATPCPFRAFHARSRHPFRRQSLIFGTSLVSLRVQLLVQSCTLYLPLYRRFYCDRLATTSLFLVLSLSLSSFPYFLRSSLYIVDPVAAEKWRSYLHATFRNCSAYVHSSPNANSRSALPV